MVQETKVWDVAIWLRPSSVWPDLVALISVDQWMLPGELVQALLQEQKETYAYKAAVKVGPGQVKYYWHVRVSYEDDGQGERVLVNEVIKQLWALIEESGTDPVEVSSQDVLELIRSESSYDPAGLYARWWQCARAGDWRAFADRWNDRRSAAVRARLVQEGERAVV
jgi:hypothetical protein